jgi:hypothetical protein
MDQNRPWDGLDPAGFLAAVQTEFGKTARSQSIEALGRLMQANYLTTKLVASIGMRMDRKKVLLNSVHEERSGLFAVFVLGLFVITDAIIEARYLQAHALIRQEIEILAHLTSIRQGRPRKPTPNVGGLREDIRRLYGSLSQSAHLSHHHIVRTAVGASSSPEGYEDTQITRFYPEVDPGIARRSYALQTFIMMQVAEEVCLGPEGCCLGAFTDEDRENLRAAIDIMKSEGMLHEE